MERKMDTLARRGKYVGVFIVMVWVIDIFIAMVAIFIFSAGMQWDLRSKILGGIIGGTLLSVWKGRKRMEEWEEAIDEWFDIEELEERLSAGELVAVEVRIPEPYGSELHEIVEFYAQGDFNSCFKRRITVSVVYLLTEKKEPVFFKSMDEDEFYETYRLY